MRHENKELYKFGNFTLNVSERLLTGAKGEKIALPEKVFATLCVLARKSGSLVRKEDLLEAVWDGAFIEENNLDKTISALRRALGEKRGERVFIETVRKHGYRFVAEVEQVEIERHSATENKSQNEIISRPKITETHNYTVERHGNVLTFAEWQPELKTENAEKFPQQKTEEIVKNEREQYLQTEQVSARRDWSKSHFAVLLIVLVLLGGLAFSINRVSSSQTEDSHRSFERINFRRVVGSDGGYSPTISPDGKTAAYRNADSSIWIENLTTGSRIQLKNGDEPLRGEHLKFAPDGNYLYYLWKNEGETGQSIMRVAVPNGVPRPVAVNAWTGAAISPDGKQIAFMRSDVGAGVISLIVINSDGTNERQIAAHRQPNFFALYGSTLAWSPDAGKIACIGGKKDYQAGEPGNIVIVDAASGAESVVTNPDWQTKDFDELVWSADGRDLLVTARNSVNAPYQIWQVSYPQGDWRRITNDLNNYSRVDVSADGKTLITAQEKSYAHLWLVPVADPKSARQITDGQTYKDGDAGLAFTPDGERIVYASSESGNYEIWTANADGSNRRQLTFGSESATEPIVTPDNRFIVFTKTTGGKPHMWRMNADGGDLIQLTNGAGELYQPAITPDSRSVIYTALNPPPRTDLFRVSIDGGEPVQLNGKFTSFVPVVSPNGKWMTYSFYNQEIAESWQSGLMTADGGEPVKTFPMEMRGIMRWTADSQSLLHFDKNQTNIWRKPIFGSGSSEQITDFKTGRIARFALSPDGKQLVLSRGNVETNVILIEKAQ